MRAPRLLASLALLLSVGTLTVLPAASADAATYKGTLRAAVKSLPLANENGTGYDRDGFKLWVDNDGDGCDARDEALIAEAVVKPSVGAGCSLTGGKWKSYYDGVVTTDPSTFDIDHKVPLAEAWASGASLWDSTTRQNYANDLGDPRSLTAVSASSNRSKGDSDPAEWMPKLAQCRYTQEWVAVKIRWGLSADSAEKKKLTSLAASCSNVTLTVRKASVKLDGGGGTTGGAPSGLRVTAIAYDPAGADTLNGEYVVLKNTTSKSLPVGGWQLKDAAGSTYTFPTMSLKGGASVKLHSGSGTDGAAHLYVGRGVAWWNNDGDSFSLSNPSGKVLQHGSYTGGGDGSVAHF